MNYRLRPQEREFCERLLSAGNHSAKYNTFQIVETCLAENVRGDFAECGVMQGAHPAVMLYVLKKHGVRDRKVHLFDSFQGIPHATVNDNVGDQETYGLSTGKMESSGISVCSVKSVIANLCRWGVYDEELVVIHQGWFEETLAREACLIDQLALLRVDVDLYQPTLEVFQHLYEKVSSGGFVVDDDFGSPECRKAMQSVVGLDRVMSFLPDQTTTVWWRR